MALLTRPGTGLPAEVTGFIGRRGDRAHVRQPLSQSRVVTLQPDHRMEVTAVRGINILVDLDVQTAIDAEL